MDQTAFNEVVRSRHKRNIDRVPRQKKYFVGNVLFKIYLVFIRKI